MMIQNETKEQSGLSLTFSGTADFSHASSANLSFRVVPKSKVSRSSLSELRVGCQLSH